ncbi:MAG: V-type ATP synthase subunit A [Defluviitaleaceae bacterium]|nr:V-type ATP synthase subunit A [Defluviitaleaceae bacterium]
MKKTATVKGINGTVVKAVGFSIMGEMVHIGEKKLLGEVVEISKYIIIQVFEDTTGLKEGDEIFGTGSPLSLTLGPGLMGGVFDGMGRNLKYRGEFLDVGIFKDITNKWKLDILVKEGDEILENTTVAVISETSLIKHYIMSPFSGKVSSINFQEEYDKSDTLLLLETKKSIREIKLQITWPVKIPRPTKNKEELKIPLITGQRVIDSLFPIALGGTAAIPGGFGTGKTMTMHQIAKYAHADILIYIGCGERGNEIKGILDDFEKLKDPKTNNSLMEKTIIIANTSNMPVSSREASIYTGVTIAEYYRDMGYNVVLIADSTSRFAEGLRELSGRLREMPAEEGYPAYLSARLANFYERAGFFKNLNGSYGSITIMGTVSPQGGDMNDTVTLNTKRYVRCFWELDRALAYSRHFPAINYLNSYSEYVEDFNEWYIKNSSSDFLKNREKLINILISQKKLEDIVKLIGEDVLHDSQKLVLIIGEIIKKGFLSQNALSKKDSYTSLEIQNKFVQIILYLYERASSLVDMYIPVSIMKKQGIFTKIMNMKESDYTYSIDLNYYFNDIDSFYNKLAQEYEQVWQ